MKKTSLSVVPIQIYKFHNIMIFNRIRWSLFRVISYSIVFINILTFGVFLYIIAPYTSYFFLNDLKFWKHLSYFHKIYFNSISYLKSIVLKDSALIISHLPLSSPPMDSPNLKLFRVSKDWDYPDDSCGTCSDCCHFLGDCCFLDTSRNKCLCYGSLFWRYFNCGRFPTTKKQLDYYRCPKYESIE